MLRNMSLSFAATFVMLLASVEPTEARAIILKATGPSAHAFIQGDTLEDATRVRLKQGDHLSLLVEGHTILIRGPRDCLVNACELREPPRISWASISGNLRRAEAAGVRGGNGDTSLATIAP